MNSNIMEIIIRAVDQASNTIKGIGASGAGMSRDMETACLKAGAALTGIGIAAKLAVDNVNASFLSFETSIAKVKSLGGATDEELARIEEKAISLSKTMPMSAEEIANGFYQMISAGYDAGTAIDSIDTITKMAVGGQLDMAKAVGAVTMVMDVYGDKAGSTEHITDVLMGAVAKFKTTLPELQQELSKCVAPANTLGISFEEVSAMAGMLKKDFVSAEEAGTAMKTMFVRLSDPAVIDYLKSIGVNVKDANGNFVGMESVLDQLSTALDAAGGNIDKNSTLIKVFGTEGYRAADSLLRQKDDMEGYVSALEDGGQAQEAFNAIMESTSAKLDVANNKMDAAKIALGDAMAPATILAADAMSTLAGFIENLPDGLQTVIGAFLTFGEALIPIGPLVIALPYLLGAIEGAIVIVSGAMATGTIAIAGTTIALGSLLLPIVAIIGAVVLFYAAWKTNFLGIRDVVGNAKEFIADRFEGIKAAFAPVKDALAEGFGKIKDAAGQLFGKMDELFQKISGGVSIVDAAKAAFDLLGRIIDAVWKIIGQQLVKAIDIAVEGLTKLIDFVGQVVDWFIKLADNPVVKYFINLADGAAKLGKSFLDNIVPATEETDKALTSTQNALGETGKSAEELKKGLDSAFGGMSKGIGTSVEEQKKTLETLKKQLIDSGVSAEDAEKMVSGAMLGMADSTQGAVNTMNSALASTANAAVQAANTIASAMAQSMGLTGNPVSGYSSKSGNYTDPPSTGGGPGMYGLTPGTYYMGPADNPSAMLEISQYGYQYSIRDDRYKGQGQEYGWAGKQAGGGSSPAAWMKLPGIAQMFGLTVTGNAPRLAQGGNITSPGKVIVGEEGPELLSLPKDAQVSPLSGNGGPQIHIHIQNLLGVPDKNSLRPVARIIKNLLTEEDNRRGAAI